MAEFNDDINLCMEHCLDYFGDPVLFKPLSGGEYKIRGILDENVSIVDTSGEIPVETPMPVLSVKLKDFDDLGIPRPVQGDEFVIKGRLYEATRNPEDGWSESRIPLFCGGDYAG